MNESIQLLQNLTPNQKQYVLMKSNEKESSIAYLLWFLFGVHYFYLNKPALNILYWITFGGLCIWSIIDLFRIPGMVRQYNKEHLIKVVAEAQLLYPENQ